MAFENLYKVSDNDARRRQTTVLIFFGLAVYIIAAVFCYFGYYETERQKRLDTAYNIESADKLCRRIQSQIRLEFVRRDEPATADDKTAVVVYRYRSPLKLNEVKQQYLPVAEIRFIDWLEKEGWQRASENGSTFNRGSQTFSIYEIENESANYEIHCSSEEKISLVFNDSV